MKRTKPVAADHKQKTANTPKNADPKQMRQFIQTFHKKGSSPCFQTYSKISKKQSLSFCGKLNRSTGEKLVTSNCDGHNVSMAINTIKGKHRRNDCVTNINALFIDLDNGTIGLDDLTALPVPPNLVVKTSPSKYHAYWLVKHCPVSKFKLLQKALAKRFDGDPNVCDPARAMRVAGTLNWKRSTPYLTKIVHQQERAPISVKRLVSQLKIEIVKDIEIDSATDTANTTTVDDALLTKIKAALSSIDADDRHTWLRVGMAIHSELPNGQGFDLWRSWSMKSDRFEAKDQQSTWNGFKSGGSIRLATLFWYAEKLDDNSRWDNFSMGKLFARNFANSLRYESSMKAWYAFNGVAWEKSDSAPLRHAKQLIEDLTAGDGDKQKKLAAYRSSAGLNAILRMAELEDTMNITESQFDTNHNVLAVKNGVVDLVTGEFRQAQPEEFIRRQANVEYTRGAKSLQWQQFVREITCSDAALAKFLRIAVGYTFFGHAKAQVFFVLEGSGGNGKGVFLRTLTAVLGQYATGLSPNIITSAYGANANAPSPALMALKGIRMGVVSELPNKRGFDTAFIKEFAGGDPITARPLHGSVVTFKPEGKLWISTNEMPDISANDHAMWRRVIPIPFNANFTGKDRDDDLEERLLQERAGILNWALSGAKAFSAKGELPSCTAVVKHRAKMRRDADVIGSWLKDRCVCSADSETQSSEVYDSYVQYAKKIARQPMGMPAFKGRLAKEGIQHKSTKHCNVYIGLALKEMKK